MQRNEIHRSSRRDVPAHPHRANRPVICALPRLGIPGTSNSRLMRGLPSTQSDAMGVGWLNAQLR
ncbi:MAG: hypothetical protein ACYCZI_12500, partial [Metallibacterium scheffleri]